jgi:hypothetical protein
LRRILLSATLAALFLCPAVALAHAPGCNTARCDVREGVRYARYHCSNLNVLPCIASAARRYRQSVVAAKRVAYCESTDNPSASSGGHLGLYQFLASTFATTPYRWRSVWEARWSSLAAMWLWAHGGKGQWQCE